MNPILPKTGCSPIGEPLFPSVVWGKACTTMLKVCRSLRKFEKHSHHEGREGHEAFGDFLIRTFVNFVCFVVSNLLCSFSSFWLRHSRAVSFEVKKLS